MLGERGVHVPEQKSIISIDNSDIALHCEVPITSLSHPQEKLGIKAAEMLLNMIEGKKKSESYEFEASIINRSSVAYFGGRIH
jgi:GntR family transcriptional regulator of arabinose operon